MSISPTAAEPLFYCPALGEGRELVTLEGEEAHHAHRVRRLAAGDRLWLFDGRGTLGRGRLRRIMDRGRSMEILVEDRHTVPPPAWRLHLACALPKGERTATLLDMATQLGMDAFTPLRCARSVARPGPQAQVRWQRICLEACKQSRRLYLPVLRDARTPAEVAAEAAAASPGQVLWIAHPGGTSLAVALGSSAWDEGGVTVLIGPEGGFTEEELAAVKAVGGREIDLGEAILRIETAAVAVLATLALCRSRQENASGGAQARRSVSG
jgi:16S rRNA (uracil1498-N3)-methyltransferase